LLHERIMKRIAREGSPERAAPIDAHRQFYRGLLAAAAAAMLAILIPARLWWVSSHRATGVIKSIAKSEPKTSPADVVLPLPPFDTALASALAPAGEQLGQGRFAYLDQDAQRFTRFVADQFDVLPTSRQ
jgi:hypothetical protein